MFTTVIIDDNRELAQILSTELVRRGHTVHCAHTGQDGLALLARTPADLIFLDLRLPDMDGTEVLEPARSLRPEAEVVIMTAYPHLSSALAAIRGRVVDYLCKPFTFDELKAFLVDKLAKYEMPVAMEIRASLPKTPVGKLSKKELIAEEMAKHEQAASG